MASKKLIKHLLFGTILLMTLKLFADRSAPPAIKTHIENGIEYSLETSYSKNKLVNQTWQCELVATKSQKVLWRKVVYTYPIDPKLETDVQEVYPKSFEIDHYKIPSPGSKKAEIKGFNIVDENDKYYFIKAK